MNYLIFQQEIGQRTDKDPVHWQGYVEFHKSHQGNKAKKFFDDEEIHIERRKGTGSEAAAYCRPGKGGHETLDKNRSSIPETNKEFGQRQKEDGKTKNGKPKNGQQGNALFKAIAWGNLNPGKELKAIKEKFPTVYLLHSRKFEEFFSRSHRRRSGPPNCFVFEGPAGTGKSYSAKKLAYEALGSPGIDEWDLIDQGDHPEIFVHSGDKSGWLEYDSQLITILEEFNPGSFPRELLCQMLDRGTPRFDRKYGHIRFSSRLIIITSNKPLSTWYSEHMDTVLRRINGIFRLEPGGGTTSSEKEPGETFDLADFLEIEGN